MRPVDQLVPHDPENGRWGDCMRACVASLLELPAEDVPHFMDGGPSQSEFVRRLHGFLVPRGLWVMTHDHFWLAHLLEQSHVPEVYHIISGPSPRFPDCFHAVIGRNGEVVFDPHPSRAGLDPATRGQWQLEFLVSTCGGKV